MPEKKLSDQTGVKKIRQDDAGKQGAIGTGGQNAPKKTPPPSRSDQPKGDKNNA